MQPTVVNFTLEATRPSNGPWTITVPSDGQQLRWLGDTVFTWTGPIEIGDQFIGRLKFVPLVTGQYGFGLIFNGRGGYPMLSDYPLQWFFSLEGELIGLGNIKKDRFKRLDFRTAFIAEDSIFIPGFKGKRPSETFLYDITVKPTFRTEDTSLVIFHLVPLVDFTDYAIMDLSTLGMTVIRPPSPIKEPIREGVPFVVEVLVVPERVQIFPRLTISIGDAGAKPGDYRWQGFGIESLFREDGSLWLIGNGLEKGLKGIMRDSIPASFRTCCDTSRDRVILKNIVPLEYRQDN